jgi:NAD(P)-dependent dehydrogenase (short-subunit alcohol dehydrogenase family)
MGNRLAGKVCVVTGAGRGIGRAIALAMAAEGAAVVINDLGTAPDGSGRDTSAAEDAAAAIVAAGGRAVANFADVSDYTAAQELIETACSSFGRVDVLVNNAGNLRDRMIFNMREEEFDSVIAVHLKGSFNCTRHASVQMRRQNSGRIINITSTSGLYGNSGQANYAAAKDGVVGLTRVVARDLGKYSITVNAIAPAAVTRLVATIPGDISARREAAGVAGAGSMGGELGRVSDFAPEDVAPFAAYLATDAAAGINGQTFVVMGGLVSLLNDPAPVRTITKTSRWAAAEIGAVFPSTLGLDLVNPVSREGERS